MCEGETTGALWCFGAVSLWNIYKYSCGQFIQKGKHLKKKLFTYQVTLKKIFESMEGV